jgi:hypothetical protein
MAVHKESDNRAAGNSMGWLPRHQQQRRRQHPPRQRPRHNRDRNDSAGQTGQTARKHQCEAASQSLLRAHVPLHSPGCLLAPDGQCIPSAFLLPHADRPNGKWLFSRQPNFFRFMPDHEAFAFTQHVFHLLLTDFDFQPLATVCHGKPKYGVVLWRRRPGPSVVPPFRTELPCLHHRPPPR